MQRLSIRYCKDTFVKWNVDTINANLVSLSNYD